MVCGMRMAAVGMVLWLLGGAAFAVEGAKDLYRSAIVVDADSGKVLFEKNADVAGPPASMTKMMLILLVAEQVRDGQLHWDDPVPVSRWASQIGGSQVYLKEGEVFTLGEMMQAIVIHSANDASVAVAEQVAGSAEGFVALMNRRAKELGLANTVFHSVHGLPPGKGQQADMSSARDLAVIARHLVKHPQILEWSGTREAPFRNGTMTLTNTNRLVRETSWVDGLKTGYYREAGFNVTATAQRDGFRLIAVVMGAPEKLDCFGQAKVLLTQAFAAYQRVVAVSQGDVIAVDVRVKDGNPRFIRVAAGQSLSVVARRGEKLNFTRELAMPAALEAPLRPEQPVGVVIVKNGDSEVGRVIAVPTQAVEKQASLLGRFFQ